MIDAIISEIRPLLDFGMVVVLWLVQLVIYPSFLRVAPEALTEWHRCYTFRVSFILIPLLFGQLGAVGWQAWHGGVADRAALGCLLGCWGLTFGVSVPLHRRLAAGDTATATRQALVRTNWPRTLLWTAVWALGFAGSPTN